MTRGNVLLAALAMSALVGCSDPKAGTLPTTSPTPSSSSTATPSASGRVPDEAYAAAIERFYDVLERGSRDPSAGADDVARLIADRCSCQRIVEFLREQARLGRHIERPVTVSDIRVARRNATEAAVFLTLRQSAGRVLDSDGHVIEELDASTESLVVDMALVHDQIVVTQIAAGRT